jgi:hypothetical protein
VRAPGLLCVLVGLAGCGDDGAGRDAGTGDGGPRLDAPAEDAASRDAGAGDDASGDAMGRDDSGRPPPGGSSCGEAAASGLARYVREGASGTGDGSDWANAHPALPDALERGATYCVADGSYGDYVFDEPPSGTLAVAVVKATVDDHGTDVGWDDAFGDGQAVFGTITLRHDAGRFTFDGQVRDEDDWSRAGGYGFRAAGFSAEVPDGPDERCADDVTVRHTDIGGADAGNVHDPDNPTGFYMVGYYDPCARWTVARNRIHNVAIAFQMAGAEDALVEENLVEYAWAKECIRGQGRAAGHVVRFNVFRDCCQFEPGDPGSGCTAEIAMWGSDTEGDYDDIEIYGNVFRVTVSDEVHTGGFIVLGGDGVSWVGVPARGARVHHNTAVGIPAFRSGILVNGSDAECRNNLSHGALSEFFVSCETASDNAEVEASAFADAAGGDFHLAAPTAPGAELPAPYDVDPDGRTRGADGVWDLGAFEHAAP